MSKNETAKVTGRTPYKMRSAGTKWGIPHDSSGDSSPGLVPPADSVTGEPAGDKASKSGEQPIMDELLPESAVEVDDGDPSTAQRPVQKKTLQKSKSMPIANPKWGCGRGRGRVTTVDFESEFMPIEWGAPDDMSADDADAKMAHTFRGFGS